MQDVGKEVSSNRALGNLKKLELKRHSCIILGIISDRCIHSTAYLGWLEWVVWGEVNSNQKYTTSIWAFRWTHDCRLPVEHIFRHRACSVKTRCFSHTMEPQYKFP